MQDTSLIYIPKKNPSAKLRILCFPYAGGSSATYLPWESSLRKDIEVAVVQLPGRGSRLFDAPYQTMKDLAQSLFLEYTEVASMPSIFFGHSMGARVAYELMSMLYQQGGELPVHMIASGSVAPCVENRKDPTYHLPDEQFIEKLRTLGGSPEEVLSNREVMELLLPALRSDFKIIETYSNKDGHIIPTKLSVFAGDQDDIELEELELWFKHFEYTTGIHWIEGGHFFIDTNKVSVLRELDHIFSEYLCGT